MQPDVILLPLLLLADVAMGWMLLRSRAEARHARAAAADAARAAAMAAAGGIDPEAVMGLLRRGVPPTLDNVYLAMQRADVSGRSRAPDPQT